MRQFHILLTVDSQRLGDVLGWLQESHQPFIIDACNLIPETPPPAQQPQPVITAPPPPKAKAKHPGGRPRSAVMNAVIEYLNVFSEGKVINTSRAIDSIASTGLNHYSVKHALLRAIRSKRFERVTKTDFRVADTSVVIVPSDRSHKAKAKGVGRPPATVSGTSAVKFLIDFVSKLPPGTQTTRKDLMGVGIAAGWTAQNLNTTIQEVYRRGYLQRLGEGKYAVPGTTPAAEPPPSATFINQNAAPGGDVFRNIVGE